MTRVKAVSFTKNGRALIEKISEAAEDYDIIVKDDKEALKDWAEDAFGSNIPMIFVGALGIAVRTIAPFLDSKLTDPPVICIDEKGSYVIPVLSGHVGGANEIAVKIAELIGANPVITTATDINKVFSVDLFAKENSLTINNKDGIREVSAKALEGKSISLCIKDYPPKEPVDIIISNNPEDGRLGKLFLSPKEYCIGVGCKKNTDTSVLNDFITETLKAAGLGIEDIYMMSSIDIKKDEQCLKDFSQKYRIPFVTFDAELLQKAEGDFTSSQFVEKTVGVDNVCERAAVLAAGFGGKLILRKQAGNGVTLAVAKRM